MSREKYKRIAKSMAIISVAILAVGCGKSSPNTPTTSVTQPTIANGGCYPITGQIPFVATGIYYDWANIVGGAVPQSNQTIGTIAIGGSPAGGNYYRSAVDGIVSMNITSMNSLTQPYQNYPYNGYPNVGTATVPNTGMPTGYSAIPYTSFNSWTPQTVNATGFIQLNPATQQEIALYVQTGRIPGVTPIGGQTTYTGTAGYNYGGTWPLYNLNASQICVSGIAINIGHFNNYLYGGKIYLYLNNTQHGYWFPI